MERSSTNNKNYNDESSLGILSMDKLSAFGDISNTFKTNNKTNTNSSKNDISERRNAERLRALETLEKSNRSRSIQTTKTMDRNSTLLERSNLTASQNQRGGNISSNISELISDETIDLNSSPSLINTTKTSSMYNKITFEPAEITGRSTLYKHNSKAKEPASTRASIAANHSKHVISVGEILATSFAEKARNLSKHLQQNNTKSDSVAACNCRSDNCAHEQNTTLSSFNNSRSLPHTADMSRNLQSSFNGAEGYSFSFAGGDQEQFDDCNFSASNDFVPGELMQSKLVMDEISWANEFAAIPKAMLSEEAKLKTNAAAQPADDIETSVTNSMIAGDPNFSVGSYFQKRSENTINFGCSNGRMPSALADVSVTKGIETPVAKIPIVDNNTYTKMEFNKNNNGQMKKIAFDNQHIFAKDKTPKAPQVQNESFLLSMSAIDRALQNLSTDPSSTTDVYNKLMGHKPHKITLTEAENDGYASNKENSDPTLTSLHNSKHSDTKSFSESLLNSTDFRQLQQSISAPRTPLSPLSDLIERPQIKLLACASEDADDDEWPSSPVKADHRRVIRTKSPSFNKSPIKNNEDVMDNEKTPVNSKKYSISSINPKSLSSTRLDGLEPLPNTINYDLCISPNLSNNASSNTLKNDKMSNLSPRISHLSPLPDSTTNLKSQYSVKSAAPKVNSSSSLAVTNSNTVTPTNTPLRSNQMVSPLSSPRSCLSSPLLDSTSNSERRILLPAGVRKANSSPASSETGSTCSMGPVRRFGGNSASAVRSTSRCSNSSEFSHRDGKSIPLKVTHMQLCWGSTKLRTDVRKSMQLKNIGDKRLAVRIGIQGPGFQLVSNDSNTIMLQSQECRTIIVNFCPTVSGAALGMLSFYSPLDASNSNISLHDIPLYGYGGNASIMVHGLLKAPVGSCFLPIGDVCELSSGPLKATFNIYNKGPLTAFANIALDTAVFIKPRLSNAFEVVPNQVIIPAGCEANIVIIFKPNREDIKNIVKKISQVLTLANMRIICGDEPNRQRMRALVQRMSADERSKLTSTMLDSLWSKFPDEHKLRDIASLKEQPEFILDLVTAARIHDVALTLNRDFDESAQSSSLFLPESDETVLFRTICASNSPTPTTQSQPLDPLDELLENEESIIGGTHTAQDEGSWSVKPTMLVFNQMHLQASLFVRNSYKSRQYCEVMCNVPNLFKFAPSEGYIAPDGGQLEIKVSLAPERVHKALRQDVVIMLSMENERINVAVNFDI